MGSGNRCGGHTLFGFAMTRWLMGLWSTQAKVEGIEPRAAWHWGRDSSVINDPLGEPGRTALYVGLPSVWGSEEGNLMFFPILSEGPLFGDTGRHKWIGHWLWRRSISLHRDPVVGNRGGSLTRDSEGKMNFQGMGCRRFCRWVSLSLRVPLGNLGRGSVDREL